MPFYERLHLWIGSEWLNSCNNLEVAGRKIIIDEWIIMLLSGLEKPPRESAVP